MDTPPQTTRQPFVDPAVILNGVSLVQGDVVADFGCGNGFYVIPAAQLVGAQGKVWAIDVLPQALEDTLSKAKMNGLSNVQTVRANVEKVGTTTIAEGTVDLVILANILHQSQMRKEILAETARVLKKGGRVLVVDWKKQAVPFGPAVAQRVDEQEVKTSCQQAGMSQSGSVDTDQYHYGLLFTK